MKVKASVAGVALAKRRLLELATVGHKALAGAAEDVEVYVETQAAKHSKNGTLVRSIYKRRDGQAWEIGHDLQHAPHALFVHWGTKRHKIKPKNKKALRWASGGQFFFAKGVTHPGFKGDAWMARAAREAPRIFEQHVAQRLAARAATGA